MFSRCRNGDAQRLAVAGTATVVAVGTPPPLRVGVQPTAKRNGNARQASAKGKILAQCDHYAKGPGYITAEVDVYSHKTIFDRYGHWLVVLSVLFLLIYTVKSCLRAYRMRQKKT